MRDYIKSPKDHIWGIWRHKWVVASVFVLLFSISASLALYLPPVYRSTATVLIEEPDVPREMVNTTISSYAAQRLQTIRQRILSTRTLSELIDRLNLYPEIRADRPMTEAVERFREAMSLEFVSADVIDPRSGRAQEATIAFKISFDYESPALAQRVSNELVSLFLGENLRQRREGVADARNFLSEEVERLENVIKETEGKLADFKRVHAGELPGELNMNQQLLLRTEQNLASLDTREQLLQERRVYLASQLAQIEPHVAGTSLLRQELDRLRAEFVRKQGRYGDLHPDVQKLKREIRALENETGYYGDPRLLQAQLRKASSELAAARENYGPEHPDVKTLERQVSNLEGALSRARSSPAEDAGDGNNPAYVQVQSQIATVDAELSSIAEQRQKLEKNLVEYEDRLAMTPEVERQFLSLKRDYDNAQTKYRELKSKLLETQVAESLETKRMSERFSLIDPPQFPSEPASPNRPAIVAVGFIFALASGVAVALLLDALDSTVRGREQLIAITGYSPLVVVPYIETQTDKVRQWSMRAAVSMTVVFAVAIGLFAINQYMAPLDVLWLQAVDRFGM